MRKESYLSLLIICGVLAQGMALISDDDIEESSDFHIRKKRVINKAPDGSEAAHVGLTRHIVQVLVADTLECAGNILQPHIILTVRNCLYARDDMYTVLSGSRKREQGIRHSVLRTEKHPTADLAMLKIHPRINVHPRGADLIHLYEGPLPERSTGIFSGWGCTHISPEGHRTYPEELMSTIMPIISKQQCRRIVAFYDGQVPAANFICTLDPRKERGACHGDEGGSLIYNGRLLGIFSYNRGVNLGVKPDIFISLNDERIIGWINLITHVFQPLLDQSFGRLHLK